MANLTSTLCSVILPTEQEQHFINFFRAKTGDRHIYRTTLINYEIEEKRDTLIRLELALECDWAVYGTLYEPISDSDEIVSLEDVCRECNVLRMSLWSEVDDSFEYLNYDKGGKMEYKSADRPRQPTDLFISEEDFDEA